MGTPVKLCSLALLEVIPEIFKNLIHEGGLREPINERVWIYYKIISFKKNHYANNAILEGEKCYMRSYYLLLEEEKKGSCVVLWENVMRY